MRARLFLDVIKAYAETRQWKLVNGPPVHAKTPDGAADISAYQTGAIDATGKLRESFLVILTNYHGHPPGGWMQDAAGGQGSRCASSANSRSHDRISAVVRHADGWRNPGYRGRVSTFIRLPDASPVVALQGRTAILTFRVKWLDAPRVVDASIMPTVVSGNTTAIMIGEKGTDMILRAA